MSFCIVTKLWVDALVRRVNLSGAYSTVERIGDETRGDVLIKTRRPNGDVSLIGRAFSPDDEMVFQYIRPENHIMTEQEASEYLKKRISYDADIWIIEIEDKEGRHFLEEKVQPIVLNDPFA